MRFFHRTSAKKAAKILKVGFRDSTRGYMMSATVTGVWVSDKTLTKQEGASGDAVLQIEVKASRKDLDFYEVKEERKPHREWSVPARLLNKGKIVRAGRDRPGEHP